MKSLSRYLAELSAEESKSVVFWSAVLIGLLFLLFFAYTQLKRWMKEDDIAPPLGFTLSDLRAMHREGKMTDEEFELAKLKMVASAKKMADSMPSVLGRKRTAPVPPAETDENQ